MRARQVLDERDIKALQLFANGESTDKVALEVGYKSGVPLKARMYKVHVALGADNRAHAIAQAMRRGLIK